MENALSAPEKKQLVVQVKVWKNRMGVDKYSYSIEGDRVWQYSSNALAKLFYMLDLNTKGLICWFQKYADFICNECL
jgi:hypothetical protein